MGLMELSYFNPTVALGRDTCSWDRFNYIYLMCIILIFLGVLLHTWRGLYSSKLKCDIREAEATRASLSQINRQLRLERESLASLSQIEQRAREQLGLVFPQPEQVVIIEQEGP
jgi:cell division protein FtsL